jgi:hypothetical protein
MGMTNVVQMRGSSGNNSGCRLWVARNINHYSQMKPTELYGEYENQLKNTKANAGLQVVSEGVV